MPQPKARHLYRARGPRGGRRRGNGFMRAALAIAIACLVALASAGAPIEMRAAYSVETDEVLVRACMGPPGAACAVVPMAADWSCAVSVNWNSNRLPLGAPAALPLGDGSLVTWDRVASAGSASGLARVRRTRDGGGSSAWDGRLCVGPASDLAARAGGVAFDSDHIAFGRPGGGGGWIPCLRDAGHPADCVLAAGGGALLYVTSVLRAGGTAGVADLSASGGPGAVGPLRPLPGGPLAPSWALAPEALNRFRVEYDAVGRRARVVERAPPPLPRVAQICVFGLAVAAALAISATGGEEERTAAPFVASAVAASLVAAALAALHLVWTAATGATALHLAAAAAASVALRAGGAAAFSRFARPNLPLRLARGCCLNVAYLAVARLVPDSADTPFATLVAFVLVADAAYLARCELRRRRAREAPVRTYAFFAALAAADAAKVACAAVETVVPASRWLVPIGATNFLVLFGVSAAWIGIAAADAIKYTRSIEGAPLRLAGRTGAPP